MDAESIREMVRAAFPVEPPGDFPVIVHECAECSRVDAAFRGQRWDQLPAEVIDYHYNSLPLLSREAYEYLLPAYILYALNRPQSNVSQFLFFSLERPRWRRNTWTLNAKQLAAVDATYKWLRELWQSKRN